MQQAEIRPASATFSFGDERPGEQTMTDTHDEMMHRWERVWSGTDFPERTLRMRVPGGWLYRHSPGNSGIQNECMVFVPDPQAQST